MPRFSRLPALLSVVALVVALLPAVALAAPEPAPANLDPWLAEELIDAPESEPLAVMVHAADAANLADATTAVATAGMSLMTTWRSIGVAVGVGTPAQVRAVAELPGVTYVEGNQPLEYKLGTSHQATRYDTARDYGPYVDATSREEAAGTPLDGRGYSIAIIDSGIDGTHPFFQWGADAPPDRHETLTGSKVVRNLENVCAFSSQDTTINDTCLQDEPSNNTDSNGAGGHGTHVAGIAAGVDAETMNGRQLHGAAPGAELIGLSAGVGIAIIGANNGLQWVLDHYQNPCAGNLLDATYPTTCWPITSTNHSYGPIGGGEYNANSATAKLQDALVAEGITNNWAAGNDGGDGTTDEVSPQAKSPTPGVIGVASYDDANTGTRSGPVSSFSSRGEKGDPSSYPDISAPGSNITSACLPTLPICQSAEDGFYGTISGTSMATPHIAGYVAVLRQADPGITPAEIEDVLEDTAHKYADGAAYESDLAARNDDDTTSFDKGHGLVDMTAALGEIIPGVDAPTPVAEDVCIVGEPQVTDPEGDASAAVIETGIQQVNEPALDIISATVSSDQDAEEVYFDIEVEDLQPAPGGTTGDGEVFDFNFTYDGASFYVQPSRSASGGQRYVLGDFGGNNGLRRTLAELTGSFNAETDIVRTVLPFGTIATNVSGKPVVKEGSTFSGFNIVSRRDLVFLVPNADTAVGTCPFTVGAESTVPPQPEPMIAIGDATVSEGDEGEAPLIVPVTLSRPADEPVTVRFESADGSAEAGADYRSVSGTLTFPTGVTRREVRVPVIGDTTVEPDEDLTVGLSDSSGPTISDGEGLGTIANDDEEGSSNEPPQLSVGDISDQEGTSGGTRPFVFPIRLSRPADETVTVRARTARNTATAPEDYVAISQEVQFPAGSIFETVTVSVVSDNLAEPDETFFLRLSDETGTAEIGDNEGIATIRDDDTTKGGGSQGGGSQGGGSQGGGSQGGGSEGGKGPPGEGSQGGDDSSDDEDDGTDVSPGTTDRDVVSRLAGQGRIQTAIEASREAFADGSVETVVLARADTFPDALAAAPLASEVEGPVLLTGSDFLDADTAAELARLGATKAYLAGGTAALKEQVTMDLAARQIETERLGGLDRFETAGLIGDEIVAEGGPVSQVVVARGDSFADALASGALAMAGRAPILLVATDDVPAATEEALGRLVGPGGTAFVAGGVGAIEPVVATALATVGLDVQRRAGASRFGTAVALVEEAVAQGAGRNPTVLASGFDFPDALTAGPAAHAMGGSLILVDPAGLDRSPETRDYLTANRQEIDTVFIAGGNAAVTAGVDDEVRAAIADDG